MQIKSRIRMGLSGLNQQRKKYNLIENGRCPTCNYIREDASHYFLKCPTHATHRDILFNEICQILAPSVNPNILLPQDNSDLKEFLEVILQGSNESDYNTNTNLFDSVFKFISHTKRFTY